MADIDCFKRINEQYGYLGEIFNELYACADKALYSVKASERDRMVEFEAMTPELRPAELRQAGLGCGPIK